jgi:hypothetical protein
MYYRFSRESLMHFAFVPFMKMADYYSLLYLPEQRAKGKGAVLDIGDDVRAPSISKEGNECLRRRIRNSTTSIHTVQRGIERE